MQLEQLETRASPATLTYHNGPLLYNTPIEVITVNQSPMSIGNMVDYLAHNYLPLIPFGAGFSGYVSGEKEIDISNINNISNQEIINLVQSCKNNVAALYMVFLPQNMIVNDSWAQNNLVGYHSFYTDNGQNIYYGVMYNTPPNTEPLSVVTSHELAEAVTDPDCATGIFGDNITQEIADIYNGQFFYLGNYAVTILSDTNGNPVEISNQISQINQQQLLNELFVDEIYKDLYFTITTHGINYYDQYGYWVDKEITNPMFNTYQGNLEIYFADVVFSNWLQTNFASQNSGG